MRVCIVDDVELAVSGSRFARGAAMRCSEKSIR
jgi:hypothetical protein